MKLRIRGNSIRLRLLRTEINDLGAGKKIEETTRLGPNPEDIFTYSLAPHPDPSPVLTHWVQQALHITLSKALAVELAETNRVSISEKIIFGDTVLKVLIEKDFKCLTTREGEDESDNFENPQESHLCEAK